MPEYRPSVSLGYVHHSRKLRLAHPCVGNFKMVQGDVFKQKVSALINPVANC